MSLANVTFVVFGDVTRLRDFKGGIVAFLRICFP